ncbi:Thioredoxin 1 [Sporomusa acidovorans DSM 3132]|uniref:Thioredoxin n=2 Tax=Sporomusa TaxID=2375 RepID=A0ABZ3J0X3_SPOA4|nr:thioredoxin [Sporomusa acidovorans]OZC14996.1 thioredoxin-1 [Sporomusa acidovorans DSM 3132]SDE83661.1 thioredoxin [Sporomusa acidovorans]
MLTIKNAAEFNESVLKSDKPSLVDFWAPWCGPCKMVAPEVEAVAQKFEGRAVVAKVNVDEQQELASQYNVMSIPTLVVFKNGNEVGRITGYRPQKDIGDILEKAL